MAVRDLLCAPIDELRVFERTKLFKDGREVHVGVAVELANSVSPFYAATFTTNLKDIVIATTGRLRVNALRGVQRREASVQHQP
jgi:hypothetical protein